MKNKRVLNSIHKKLKQRKKKYSKSILATNKLHAKSDIFRTSYLFKKPGKRRIYNPNAKYFEHGGPHEVFLSAGKFRPQTPTIGTTLGYKQVFPKRETTWSLTGNLGYGRNLETDKEGLSASINAENFGKFFGGQRRVNAITNLQAFVEPGNYGAQVYAGPNLHWGSHPKRRLPRGTGRVDFQPFNMRFGYQSTPLAADSGDALFEGTGGRINYGLGTKLKGEYALPKKGALRGSKMNPVLFGDVGVDFDFLKSNYDEEGVASGSIYGVPEGFTINPSFAANVGIRLPIDGINLGRRRKPSLVEDDPYYNPGIRVSDPEAVEAYEEPDEYKDGGTPKVKQRRGARENPDGSTSTHIMMAEYIPERGWVAFPSLFQNSIPYADDSQNWVDMSGEKDWMKIYEEAQRRGEVYDFGEDKEAALAFGEGSWKDQLPQQRHGGPHGGPGSPPTQADSLRVYNQAVKLQNFYDSKLGNELVWDPDTRWSLSDFTEHMNERGDKIRQQHLEHGDVSFINKAIIRGNKDPNVEYLSDIVTGAIDPRAPLAIYDKRIKPQGIMSYEPRRSYLKDKYIHQGLFNMSSDEDMPPPNYGKYTDAYEDIYEQVEQKYEYPDILDPNYEKLKDDYFTKIEMETHERLRDLIKEMYPSKLPVYDEFLKKYRTTNYGDAPGAWTTIPYYDPIMVKPWSMLTEEEKEYRRKFKPKPKGTLDPKKSVNVNLIKLGLATDTKSANVVKKELYAKLFPGKEYKGKADQNTKLNKYIFDNNLTKEDIEEVINPSILPAPPPPQYEIEPVAVEPEISPLPVMPAVLPSDLGDVEIVSDVAEEDFDNDYRAERVVDKEKYYKVNKKGKLRRGPFGTKTIRRVRYVPIEEEREEQLYPEGFVPRFEHGGEHDPPNKKPIILDKNNPDYAYTDYAKRYGIDLSNISAEDIEALMQNQRAVQDYWQNQQNLYKPLTSAYTAVGDLLKPEDRNDYLRAVSKYHTIPGSKNYLDDLTGWGLLDYKNLDLSDKGIRRDDYPKDLQKFIMDNATDNISYLPQAELGHDDFKYKQGYDDFPLVRVDDRFPISGIPAYQQIDKKCTTCPSVNVPEYDPVMLARLQNQKVLDDWTFEEVYDGDAETEVPTDIDPGTAKSYYKPIRRGIQFNRSRTGGGGKRRYNNPIMSGKGLFGNQRIKQEGGSVELGDEVDEATMKRLKKLGYTFEEI